MTDQSGVSGEFVFPTSDQAGGVSQQHQQSYGLYNAERDTNAPGTSGDSTQAQEQESSLRFSDFSAQQQQQLAPGFTSFGFSPSVPSGGWDWTNSIDFSEFNQYEPQGELVQELQNQNIPNNDFSIPLPVANSDLAYQSFQQAHGATPTPTPIGTQTHTPLSPPPPPRPTQPRPTVQTGMKRKNDSEPTSAVSQTTNIAVENPSKRQNKSRQSSEASITSPGVPTLADTRPSMTRVATVPAGTEPTSQATSQSTSQENGQNERRKDQSKGTGPQGRVIDVSKPRKIAESPNGLDNLPSGKVFPIQIGSELFRLSGASLSSDAPSYFSHFFGQQLHDNGGRAGDVRTLYIDRDPDTFREIALHLQGYHITPRDGEHFVKLFADAQFYSLPRLTKQLFRTDIFVRIGGCPFQVPRDLFSAPGNSPNYFSLGFAQFFSTPSEAFPGLDRNALLRPPPISPPSVPNRNGETFGELIQLLKGYNVEIGSSEHRSRLLRDARYFHLKGLEQRLIPCEISYNLKRHQSEILLRLEDIRQSGVSLSPDRTPGDSESGGSTSGGQSISASPNPTAAASPATSSISTSSIPKPGYVSYARPYTDDHAQTKILILEISSAETTTLHLPLVVPTASAPNDAQLHLRATFHNSTLARITSLFSVIASKMGLPATQPLGLMYLQSGGGVATQPVSPANSGVSERRVRVRLDADCALELDGKAARLDVGGDSGRIGIHTVDGWAWGGRKVHHDLGLDEEEKEVEWVVKRAHWRLRVEPVEGDGEARKVQVVLCGVKIEAFSVERRRNMERGFLGS